MSGSARPRPHEILTAGYFALTGLFVLAFGSPLSEWWPTLVLHAAVVLIVLQLLPRLPERGWTRFLRDWAPLFALSFIYMEVARLNDLFAQGYFDRPILRLEAVLFGSQPSVALRRIVRFKPLSEYLHFGYFAYYTLLPALGGSLYLQRRFGAFRYAVTTILAVFFFCYVCFIIFPVAGPWYVFARPAPDEMGWVFPHIEHAVLEHAASEGAAFPSSHVAAALAMWLLAWRLSRPVFRVFAVIVPALLVGTVYGGFHYALDAVSGSAVGIAGYLAGPWIYRALGGDPAHTGVAAEGAAVIA